MDKRPLAKALEQNPQQTISEAERLNAELSRRAQKIKREAESGRETTVDLEITYAWKISSFENNVKAFLFLGLGKEALEREGFYSVKGDSFRDINTALRGIKKDKEKRKNFRFAAGAYNSSQKILSMRRMAEDQLKDLRKKYPAFKPLFDFISTESVHATISHELTHAYIDENTVFNASGTKYNRDISDGGRRAKLIAIDEAAAQYTGTLLGDEPSDPSNYKRKGFSRSEMHTAENLLAAKVKYIANDIDVKIDQVRETAAKGIRRIQRHPSFDIIQAIDAEELERAKAFRQAVYYMKAAEYNSADVLDKLNLLDREIKRGMRELEDEIDLEYHDELKQIFPKDTPLDEALKQEIDVELDDEMGLESDLNIGPGQENFSEDISLDEEFEELEGYQLNETLKALEDSREKLLEIARSDDLTQEEVQSLKETEQEIESLVEFFREKIGQKREGLETQNRSFASPRNTSQSIINNPEALRQAEELLQRYQRLIAEGVKICQRGTEVLSKVHDREETSAQLMQKYSEKEEYRVIGDAIQYTGDSYRALKAGDQILKRSYKNVKIARKSLKQVLSS